MWFTDVMIVYISNPKNSPRQLLQLMNTFRKTVVYKIKSQKSVDFPYKNDKWTENELRGATPLKRASKNKISLGMS